MNLAQRRRAAEEATPTVPTGGGCWLSGTSLTIGQVRFPRGSRVPDEIVAAIEPGRLAVLMSNRLLMHRLGPLPANAPQPVPLPPPIDPAVERAEQNASLRRDGFADWELTAGIPTPPGNAAHPSTMVQPTRLPISIGGGYIDK
jgi:hypothetical protein